MIDSFVPSAHRFASLVFSQNVLRTSYVASPEFFSFGMSLSYHLSTGTTRENCAFPAIYYPGRSGQMTGQKCQPIPQTGRPFSDSWHETSDHQAKDAEIYSNQNRAGPSLSLSIIFHRFYHLQTAHPPISASAGPIASLVFLYYNSTYRQCKANRQCSSGLLTRTNA